VDCFAVNVILEKAVIVVGVSKQTDTHFTVNVPWRNAVRIKDIIIAANVLIFPNLAV
jgi:sporulation protein YlmC with PRC-barrel domain